MEEQKGCYSRFRLWCNQPHHLGHTILHSVRGFSRPSSVGKGAIWNLQWKNHNMGPWISGVKPGTVENYSVRKMSVWYWALVNTEHWTREHILSQYLKLPICCTKQVTISDRPWHRSLDMRKYPSPHATHQGYTSVPPLACTYGCMGVPYHH